MLNAADVEEAHVICVPKAYPAYVGSYGRFEAIRDYTDGAARGQWKRLKRIAAAGSNERIPGACTG
jgi:hypothetical protein